MSNFGVGETGTLGNHQPSTWGHGWPPAQSTPTTGDQPIPSGGLGNQPQGPPIPPQSGQPIPSPNPPGTGPGGQTTDPRSPNALATVMAAFPWLARLGLTGQLQSWTAQSLTPDAIVGMVRQTPQWAQRYPGIKHKDGSLLMNEGTYESQEQGYKQVLQQAGFGKLDFENPATFTALFQQGVDPNELKTRTDLYNKVIDGGQAIKDAFYVYAGISVDNDTLYSAMVDPDRAAALSDEYNQKVASSPVDYQTWITRATEVGLANVTSTLQSLQAQGLDTGAALAAVRQASPQFAQSMMDQLYHGGNPQGGDYLDLNALQRSFDYAVIGSAASTNGLALPTGDLMQQIRAAGVTASAAQKSFGEYAGLQGSISGAAARAGLGQFTQDDWEKSQLLQQGAATQKLNQAMAGDKALTVDSGTAAFSRQTVHGAPTGVLTQPGYGPVQ